MKFFKNGIFYHAEMHQNKKSLPCIVLLHGFMGSGEIFNELLPRIKPFCNPVTIDLLGHGKSGGSTEPERYHSEKQVEDLVSILQRLNLQKSYLYGYSMGGRLALQILFNSTQNFNGLILESAGCGIESSNARSSRKKIDAERASEIRDDYEQFLENWLNKPLFKSKPDEEYIRIFKNQNPEYLAASLKGFGSGVMDPLCGRLGELNIRTKLFAGELDDKYREIMLEMSRRIPESKVEIIAEAGHRIHTDNPDTLAEKLNLFI